MSGKKSGYLPVLIDEIKSALIGTDRVVLFPAGKDEPEGELYELDDFIDYISDRISREVAKGSVEIADCSPELLYFIIYARLRDGTVPQIPGGTQQPALPGGTTPIVPPTRTELPTPIPGLPTPRDITPDPDPDPIPDPFQPGKELPTIPTVDPRPRIIDTKVITPVIHHPSEPQGVYLREESTKLTVFYQEPADNGGEDVTFWVAIVEGSDPDAVDVTTLTWIEKGTALSHVFPNLDNGVQHIVFVRCQNSTGYSYAVHVIGTPPAQTPELTITLSIVVLDETYHTLYGRPSKVRFQLQYSKPVPSVMSSEITARFGTVESVTGAENSWIVTVQPTGRSVVSITVSVNAASTSVDEMIAAAVTSSKSRWRPSIDPDPPRVDQIIERETSVRVLFRAPNSARNVDRYEISLDGVTWTPILKSASLAPFPNERYEFEFVKLTPDVRVTIYVRSWNIFGTSDSVIRTAVPGIEGTKVTIPKEDIPLEPKNAAVTIQPDGSPKVTWDGPARENYDGFEIRRRFRTRDPEDWVKLDRNAREHIFTSFDEWGLAHIDLRSYNNRTTSDIIQFRDVVQAMPPALKDLTVNAGNNIIQIQTSERQTTPLDGSGFYERTNAAPYWFRYEVRNPSGDLVAEGDAFAETFGGIPAYVHPLHNDIEYTVKCWSRTDWADSPIVLERTVTPAASHAGNSNINPGDATGFTLTVGDSGELDADWDAPAVDGGGDGIAYYRIDVEPANGFAYFTEDGSDATEIVLDYLTAGTTYTATLVAVHNNGVFGQSIPDYDENLQVRYDSRGVVVHRPSTRNSSGVTATGTPN